MECTSSVSKSLLSSAKLTKVLGCLGGNVSTEFEGDPADVLSSYFHIEVHLYSQQELRKINDNSIRLKWAQTQLAITAEY